MRTQRFAVFGAVQTPGQYSIPVAEYRLLEGLTAAGGFSEAPGYLYVIRQVPLTQSAGGQPTGPATAPPAGGMQPSKPTGDSLIDVIDQLSRPGGQATPPAPGGAKPSPAPAPAPGSPPPPTGPTGMSGTTNGAAPAPKPLPPKGSPAVLQPAGTGAKQPADRRPPVDLIDPTKPVAPAQPASTAAPQPPADSSEGTWVNIDGRWVKVRKPQVETATPPEHLPGMPARGELAVTQRVIRIPTSRVALGDARYNIIIRPGDVVRVPPQPSGTIFISGQVARVGAYSLTEGLTLTRAITSAGGLSAIAIPERMDLVRMVGPNQQGFVRLNLRAMEEGTHPDVFLKPNDRINIGTNFWATPLAVIRNGFRASYGFGLIADRNFGDDIFGAPPTNQFGD
jgi:polysaccharide biosynthesis/export protein